MNIIHKAKDNSVKMILKEPELFAEFLRDFISVDILKNIDPADIEDITERLLSLVSEQKDSDTIKRINLKDNKSLFVIAIVEHESKVNFRASFKLLLYIALILDQYEQDANREASKRAKKDIKVTLSKDFKYPPILPIIFYDGASEWTAETNFLNRTEMNDIFKKYIPSFEYELVSLNKYSFEDLAEFGDVLSLFMMLDKLKKPEDLEQLGNLPKEYVKRLDTMNVPQHLKDLLVRVITVLLNKIDVSQDEINDLVEKIDQRGVSAMLTLENYSVQETRRQAKKEAKEEARKEAKKETERRVEEERCRADKAEFLLKSAVKLLLDQGNTVSEVATKMGMSEHDIVGLLPEL